MTFIIDTGAPDRDFASAYKISKRDGLRDGVLDSLPPNATQTQIDAAIVSAILGDLRTPKKIKTVRIHLIALWPLIAELVDRDPESFDAILMEFAELTTVLR